MEDISPPKIELFLVSTCRGLRIGVICGRASEETGEEGMPTPPVRAEFRRRVAKGVTDEMSSSVFKRIQWQNIISTNVSSIIITTEAIERKSLP
jgi:hypothetical protein